MLNILLMFLTVSAQAQKATTLFQDDFEGSSLSWTISGGEWEWGAPQGIGGANYGNPDPSSAHSGQNVIGTDLTGDGDYSANANCSITSPAINCTGYIGVKLSFYRWLNVETSNYDQAKVEVSNDGTNWTVVWQNPGGDGNHTTDNSWVYQEIDISDVADNQPTVYVRFSLTSDGSWQFSGWNIDDVVLTGSNQPDIHVISYSPKKGYTPGDTDVPFTILLKNNGTPATSVQATLQSNDPYITVSSTNNPFNAGNLSYKDTISNSYAPYYISISPSCPNGYDATLIVDISADGGYSSQDTLNIHVGLAKWTFMVYINGDNNLSDYGDYDRSEMESVGSNSNLNIVVQQDWQGNTGTVRWFVNKGSSDTILALSEQDMGVPSTLIDFVNWTIDNYPAKHYALVIWDHGSGWDKSIKDPINKGFSWDDNSGSHFSVAGGDLDTALYYIKEHLGRNLDILGFDACLMATAEVANVAKKYVNYIVFSEKTEPGDGWPYDDILDTVALNPDISPHDFAIEIAKRYVASYSGGSQGSQDATQAAIDLGENFHKLLIHLDHLSRALIDAGGKGDTKISGARRNTVEMDDGTKTLVDLYDAVDDIKAKNINSTINALCDSVETYVNSVVLYHGYYDTGNNGWDQTHGLSIYYPNKTTSPDASYANFDFAHTNTWYDFISGASSTASISGIKMHILSYTYDDLSNHNGHISQGESVLLYPVIENSGSSTASGVVLHLESDDPNVTIGDSIINVGDIPAFSSVDPQTAVKFTVSSEVPVGSNVVVKIVLTSTNKVTEDVEYLTFKVEEPLSIREENTPIVSESKSSLIARGSIVYNVRPSTSHVDVSLYSVDGRLIKKLYSGIPHNNFSLKVSQMKQGIYFIVEKRTHRMKKMRVLILR